MPFWARVPSGSGNRRTRRETDSSETVSGVSGGKPIVAFTAATNDETASVLAQENDPMYWKGAGHAEQKNFAKTMAEP